jgi:dienelactone hydrolase
LANRGFATLTLAYFAAPDLPDELVEIPLEYFIEGIDWLAAQAEVDGGRLGVMGGSRGGELALLLGSLEPRLRVVVADVPSHVLWGGCCSEAAFGQPAWTLGGEALPWLKLPAISNDAPRYWAAARSEFLPYFWMAMANEAGVAEAAIPVEKIQGPILMVTGGDDGLWPSRYMADQVVARLRAHEFSFPVVHACFDRAGHAVGVGTPDYPAGRLIDVVHPVAKWEMHLGGTPEAMAAAAVDAFSLTVEFLTEHLAAPRARVASWDRLRRTSTANPPGDEFLETLPGRRGPPVL